jgi:chromosome partitioning protein
MHTIALIAQKGGCGKTTMALSLAVAATEAGLTALVLDIDPQATACKWSDRRKSASPERPDEPVVIDAQPARLSAALQKARENGVDLVLIDTPGQAEHGALAAAKEADLVLIPCRPQAFDIETIPTTREILALAGHPPALVVLNSVIAQGDRHEQARKEIERHAMPVCPHTFGNRVAFGDAGVFGQTPMEFEPHGLAAEEIRQVYKYTSILLDKSTKERNDHEEQKGRSRRAAG